MLLFGFFFFGQLHLAPVQGRAEVARLHQALLFSSRRRNARRRQRCAAKRRSCSKPGGMQRDMARRHQASGALAARLCLGV